MRKCVNFDKSIIFYISNTSVRDRRVVETILEMRSSTDIEKYLGLPTFIARCKNVAFQSLKDRFNKRVESWSVLSQGGKEAFVKLVLQSIRTYSMTCFLLPKSLCDDLEKKL